MSHEGVSTVRTCYVPVTFMKLMLQWFRPISSNQAAIENTKAALYKTTGSKSQLSPKTVFHLCVSQLDRICMLWLGYPNLIEHEGKIMEQAKPFPILKHN